MQERFKNWYYSMLGLPVILAGILAFAIGGAACSTSMSDSEKNTRGRGDGTVGIVHDNPSEVFNFPDHYSNIATQCDGHGHRIYSATRNESAAPHFVVIDDPSCSK